MFQKVHGAVEGDVEPPGAGADLADPDFGEETVVPHLPLLDEGRAGAGVGVEPHHGLGHALLVALEEGGDGDEGRGRGQEGQEG